MRIANAPYRMVSPWELKLMMWKDINSPIIFPELEKNDSTDMRTKMVFTTSLLSCPDYKSRRLKNPPGVLPPGRRRVEVVETNPHLYFEGRLFLVGVCGRSEWLLGCHSSFDLLHLFLDQSCDSCGITSTLLEACQIGFKQLV